MNKSNRVLVVEDDAAIVRALSSFLTDEGFLCKSANGQAEALRLFEQDCAAGCFACGRQRLCCLLRHEKQKGYTNYFSDGFG